MKKKTMFAIRKLSIGAAAVLLSASLSSVPAMAAKTPAEQTLRVTGKTSRSNDLTAQKDKTDGTDAQMKRINEAISQYKGATVTRTINIHNVNGTVTTTVQKAKFMVGAYAQKVKSGTNITYKANLHYVGKADGDSHFHFFASEADSDKDPDKVIAEIKAFKDKFPGKTLTLSAFSFTVPAGYASKIVTKKGTAKADTQTKLKSIPSYTFDCNGANEIVDIYFVKDTPAPGGSTGSGTGTGTGTSSSGQTGTSAGSSSGASQGSGISNQSSGQGTVTAPDTNTTASGVNNPGAGQGQQRQIDPGVDKVPVNKTEQNKKANRAKQNKAKTPARKHEPAIRDMHTIVTKREQVPVKSNTNNSNDSSEPAAPAVSKQALAKTQAPAKNQVLARLPQTGVSKNYLALAVLGIGALIIGTGLELIRRHNNK